MNHVLPEVWAGVECSYLVVDGVVRDQLEETGHASRAGDLDRLAGLGAKAVRYPVLWGRGAAPEPTDWRWADERLAGLRQLGLEPVVGLLHHGFGLRDPLAPGYAEAFAMYAARVADRYPYVMTWLPVNEPLTTARFAGLYGWWAPHHRDHGTFIRLLLAQCLAQRAASRAIRRLRPGARILVTEDVGATSGTVEMADNARHDDTRRWLTFDLLNGRVDEGHPLWSYLMSVPETHTALETLRRDPEPPDMLGLNYYVTSDRHLDHRLTSFPAHLHGSDGRRPYVDVEAARVPGAAMQGFGGVLTAAWSRYRMPLALTEVHLAGDAQDQVAWWAEAWLAATDALRDGVDVRSVTAWAVFGATDWDSLLRERRARLEPGCLGEHRPPERSLLLADAIRHAAKAGRVPAYQSGWWRRDERFLFDPADTPDGTGKRVS